MKNQDYHIMLLEDIDLSRKLKKKSIDGSQSCPTPCLFQLGDCFVVLDFQFQKHLYIDRWNYERRKSDMEAVGTENAHGEHWKFERRKNSKRKNELNIQEPETKI